MEVGKTFRAITLHLERFRAPGWRANDAYKEKGKTAKWSLESKWVDVDGRVVCSQGARE